MFHVYSFSFALISLLLTLDSAEMGERNLKHFFEQVPMKGEKFTYQGLGIRKRVTNAVSRHGTAGGVDALLLKEANWLAACGSCR